MDDFTYADPATLQGQLQRGRGLGARCALAEPGAAELVYQCVITDSRWDRQTDTRDSYLARLILQLDLPLAPIERHLFSHDGDDDSEEIDLALQVLALLPFAGRIDAAALLRRYAIEGLHWAAALEAIEWTGPQKIPQIWAGLDHDVVASHDDTQLAAHVHGAWEPWTSWARTQPRIRRILDEHLARPRPPARRPAANRYAEASAVDLARLVSANPGPDRRLALQELGRRGSLAVLNLAEDASLRNAAGWTPGMPRALHYLGTGAVARARRWAGSGDSTLEQLAVGVLSEFGDREDGPVLLSALSTAASAGSWCATETPARGLGRLRAAEATDALACAWAATAHSVAREAILEGLRGCAPEAADGYAVEALDDCEPGVQRAACGTAPNTAFVRARLSELRDDPLAPEAHDAAGQRLSQLTG